MKRQQRTKLLCALLSSTLLWGGVSLTALATETEEPTMNGKDAFELGEITVTANRLPTKVAETAANVTVITRDDIKRKGAQSLADVLGQNGIYVEVHGGSPADDTVVKLNGDDRIVILVDGRKINWQQQLVDGRAGYSLTMLPGLDSVERIEVVKGAASSLYGSSAAGGVINIITRKGNEKNTTASTEFGSWNSQRYRLQTGGKEKGTSYLITAERWTQGDYEYKDPGTGRISVMPNSDFTRKSLSVRIDKELGEGKNLTFYFDHLTEDAGYPQSKPGLGYGLDYGGNHYYIDYFNPNGKRSSVSNNVSLEYQWRQGEHITNHLQVYRNHYNGGLYNYTMDFDKDSTLFRNQADGLEWNQSRKLNDHHTLTGGLDWRRESLSDRVFINDDSPTDMQHTMRNVGLFLEDRWQFNEKWSANAGLRFDDHSVYGTDTTSRIGVNRKLSDATNLYLSWGQVFRGPDLEDLFYPSMDGFQGNPNLKPETGYTTTLGLNTKLSGGTVVQFSLFSAQLKNAIVWDQIQIPWQPRNIARQKKQGLDLSVTHPLSRSWDLTAGYSYLQIQEASNGSSDYQADKTNSQPNAYRLDLHYHQNKWDVSLLGRGASGRSLDTFSSRQYWVLDLAASYQITPVVRFYAKACNLTNRAYETKYSNWGQVGTHPMPSRQIIIGMERRL